MTEETKQERPKLTDDQMEEICCKALDLISDFTGNNTLLTTDVLVGILCSLMGVTFKYCADFEDKQIVVNVHQRTIYAALSDACDDCISQIHERAHNAMLKFINDTPEGQPVDKEALNAHTERMEFLNNAMLRMQEMNKRHEG